MARPRKPIPKTQRQLSIEKQQAFKGIEDRGDVGNPNSADENFNANSQATGCLLYTSPSPRDRQKSRMPSSA